MLCRTQLNCSVPTLMASWPQHQLAHSRECGHLLPKVLRQGAGEGVGGTVQPSLHRQAEVQVMPTAGRTWRRCWLRCVQGQQLHSSHSQRLLPQPGHTRRRVGGQRAGSVQQVPGEGADGCIAVPMLGTASATGVAS